MLLLFCIIYNLAKDFIYNSHSSNMLFVMIVVFLCTSYSVAQIPCDEAYGLHCPEASGFEVGECLKNLDPSELSEDCKNYIVIHDLCREDITKNCPGNEYTGDVLGNQGNFYSLINFIMAKYLYTCCHRLRFIQDMCFTSSF